MNSQSEMKLERGEERDGEQRSRSNTMTPLISRYTLNALLLAGMVGFSSCGVSSESQHLQSRVDNALDDVDRDRDAVRSELMDLRQDIDHKILATEEELEKQTHTAEETEEKQQLLLELQQNRDRVQQALIDLERSDESSWLEVRQRSKSLTRAVDRWFERQAEREDLRG